jgi:hypothetical protein
MILTTGDGARVFSDFFTCHWDELSPDPNFWDDAVFNSLSPRGHGRWKMGASVKDRAPINRHTLGFNIFVSFTLLVGLVGGYLGFVGITDRMQEIVQIFLDGGAFMVLIQLVHLVVLFNLCGLASSYLSGSRVSSSLLSVPLAIALILGLIGTSIWLEATKDALPLSLPTEQIGFASWNWATANLLTIFGASVSATTAWLVALLAGIRSLVVERSGERKVWGILILGWGLTIGAGLVWVFFGWATSDVGQTAVVAMGAASLGSISCLGLGSIRRPATPRDGANRLLLAVATLACVGLTWLAEHLVARYLAWNGLDHGIPERRSLLMAHWIEVGHQIDMAGAAFAALTVAAVLVSVIASFRMVLRGAMRFRVSAAITTVMIGAALALGLTVEDRGTTLLDLANRAEGSYFARAHDGFRPVRLEGSEVFNEPRPTVVIGYRSIEVDGQRVSVTQGFTSSSQDGEALRTTLAERLEAWDRQRQASPEALENPLDPTVEAPWRQEPITLAVDRRVSWSALEQVINVLRELRQESVDLLASRVELREADGRRGEPLPLAPKAPRLWPWDFGRHHVSIRSDQGGLLDPRFSHRVQRIDLRLVISDRGFHLGSEAAMLPEGCVQPHDDREAPVIGLRSATDLCPTEHRGEDRTTPVCAYDLPRLRECLIQIKNEYPGEQVITVGAQGSVTFEAVAAALETARGSLETEDGPRLFTDQILLPSPGGRAIALLPAPPPVPESEPELALWPPGYLPIGHLHGSFIGLGRVRRHIPGHMSPGGAPRPVLRLGTPEVRGSLSRDVIRRYVRRRSNEIRSCYETGLVTNPRLTGRVTVRFVISATGTVMTTAVESSTLGNLVVEGCVTRAIERISFPSCDCGGVVIVTYPLMFRSEG